MGKVRPPSPPQRWRKTALALCAAILLGTALSSGTAVATSGLEAEVHDQINGARRANGVPRLALSERLSQRAHNHSERMADEGSLFHSCLDCGGSRNTSTMAENVGVGGSLGAVHKALMASSGHRANILGAAFDRVGVGVVRRGGRVWVTQIFAG